MPIPYSSLPSYSELFLSYINNFDWTTVSPYYPINSQCNPDSFTLNPFQSNQSELLTLSLSKDMKPIAEPSLVLFGEIDGKLR